MGRHADSLCSDQAGSYLSPTHLLSSFSGMGINYRDYLPSSPGKAVTIGAEVEERSSSWQECDLGDGQGRRSVIDYSLSYGRRETSELTDQVVACCHLSPSCTPGLFAHIVDYTGRSTRPGVTSSPRGDLIHLHTPVRCRCGYWSWIITQPGC